MSDLSLISDSLLSPLTNLQRQFIPPIESIATAMMDSTFEVPSYEKQVAIEPIASIDIFESISASLDAHSQLDSYTEYLNFSQFYEAQQDFIHENSLLEETRPPTVFELQDYKESMTSLTYNETTYKQMARFAISAYCARGLTGQKLKNWSCKTCKETAKPSDIVTFRSKSNIAGYVAFLPATNSIVVSFAGTDPISITNWITDLNFFHTDYAGCKGCKVHRGFQEAYRSVRVEVQNAVKTMKKNHPGAKVMITGHSLGGALATLALSDFLESNIPVQTPSYIFGAPRVGNDLYAAHIRALSKGSIPQIRGVHYKDPVVQLPPASWGFQHPSQEIFFTGGEKSFKQCSATTGEDKSCSYISVLPLIIPHAIYHAVYGKADMLGNYLDCKLN